MTAFGNYDAAENPDATLKNVTDDRNAGSYKNLVFLFCNSDLEDEALGVKYPASLFTQKIYIDNLRVVNTTAIPVSDFDDETEE
jgi:hypothetical protein